MAFPHFWVSFMLQEMGWPKKEGGFFNKKWIVDSWAVDTILEQMIFSGVLIGAEAPGIGTAQLTEGSTKKEWNDEEFEGIISFWEEASTEALLSSWVYELDRINLVQKSGPKTLWDTFKEGSDWVTVARFIYSSYVGGLWLGLTKPKQMGVRLDEWCSTRRTGAIGTLPSKGELLKDALVIIKFYETERKIAKEPPSSQLIDYINERRSSEKFRKRPKSSNTSSKKKKLIADEDKSVPLVGEESLPLVGGGKYIWELIYCKYCGFLRSGANEKYCTQCGKQQETNEIVNKKLRSAIEHSLTPTSKVCKTCGNKITETNTESFCHNCGTPL